MKLARILFAAAGLATASLGVTTAADAQYYGGHDQGYHRNHDDRRGYDDHRGNRWNRGHHGWHGRQCHIERRHHHNVRVCR